MKFSPTDSYSFYYVPNLLGAYIPHDSCQITGKVTHIREDVFGFYGSIILQSEGQEKEIFFRKEREYSGPILFGPSRQFAEKTLPKNDYPKTGEEITMYVSPNFGRLFLSQAHEGEETKICDQSSSFYNGTMIQNEYQYFLYQGFLCGEGYCTTSFVIKYSFAIVFLIFIAFAFTKLIFPLFSHISFFQKFQKYQKLKKSGFVCLLFALFYLLFIIILGGSIDF